jgi:iron complex outermembrane receptor protein
LKTEPTPQTRLNVAAFYDNYTNLQETTVVLLPGTPGENLIANAASARMYGLEADAQWRLTHELTVNAGLDLIHARYVNFPNATVQVPTVVNEVVCLCGNTQTEVDASGKPLLRTPDYTVSLGPDYRHEFAQGTLDLSGSLFWSGKFTLTPDARVYQNAYVNLNAQASFEPAGSKVTLSVWGKNLTNNTIISEAAINPPVDAVGYAPPRTYGFRAEYRF